MYAWRVWRQRAGASALHLPSKLTLSDLTTVVCFCYSCLFSGFKILETWFLTLRSLRFYSKLRDSFFYIVYLFCYYFT